MNWLTLDRLTMSGWGDLEQTKIPRKIVQRVTFKDECQHHWLKHGRTRDGRQRFVCYGKCGRTKVAERSELARRREKLLGALEIGASLAEAACYAGVSKNTAWLTSMALRGKK